MEDNKIIPAYEGREPYLFLSYAHKDRDQVLPLIEKLFEEKIRVWYDEGIAPGSEWPKNIEDHLRDAEGVLVCVSENSLASVNCENEVRNVKKKECFVFSVDGSRHPKLRETHLSDTRDALLSAIPERYKGDGVSGYRRAIGQGKDSLWNLLLLLAGMLILLFSTALYGLNQGWFDAMIPGLQASAEEGTKEEGTEGNENVTGTLDTTILNAALTSAGRADLLKKVPFNSSIEKSSFYKDLNFSEWGEGSLTYGQLVTFPAEEFHLSKATDRLLEMMLYLPELQVLYIDGGDENLDLSILIGCPKLTKVVVKSTLFPVILPEEANFVVEYSS